MTAFSRMQRWKTTPFRSLLLIFAYIAPATALRNVTVDDETGDEETGSKPTYTPSGSSGNWEQGANCTGCLVKPDSSKAHDGTWHDATHGVGDPFQRAISISFNGTAVYAFFICANTVEFATTLTNLTFALDGTEVGTFVHEPKATTDYEYNVPGYVNTSLPRGNHQLVIQTTGDQNASLILFDYLIYSTNQAKPSSTSATPTTNTATTSSSAATNSSADQASEATSSTKIGPIVGIVVAVVAAAVLGALAFICWRRRRGASGLFSGRRKRAEVNLDEEGSDYSLQNAAAAVPYSDLNNSSSDPFQSEMAESQQFLSASGQTGTMRPTMSSVAPSSFAVQNPDGSGMERSEVSTASAVARGDVAAAATGLKARERQAEIARQVEEMQQRVALLRSRSTVGGFANRQGSAPAESVAGSASDNETELRNQIAALQAEVERLQSQQEYFQQLGWGDEPPPEYAPVEDAGVDNNHTVSRHG